MAERDNRKVVLVGTGMVGMSYAYAMLNQNICDELVLIDLDKTRAAGEAMDLNHGLAFSGSHMRIFSGDYKDCRDASIVAICAGVAQKPGESRPDLLDRNAKVFRSILDPVIQSGFAGIFLIATNPVDIMSQITQQLSGWDTRRVIGTGTTLDTARLRYMVGSYFNVDPRNVHAYVMAEHGDTEFVAWSNATIATKLLSSICAEGDTAACNMELSRIENDVRTAAQQIIAAKGATYYGIGMSMVRITRAILGDESSVLTVSAMLQGEYGEKDVYIGAPCVVGAAGVQRVIQLDLDETEQEKFHHSCETLRELYAKLHLNG